MDCLMWMRWSLLTTASLFAPQFAHSAAGAWDVAVVRPGPCSAQAASYLLAGNSAAIVRVSAEPSTDNSDPIIIVFRPQPTRGWASQRLLSRFDLKLDDSGARIINSGAFCTETPIKEPGS